MKTLRALYTSAEGAMQGGELATVIGETLNEYIVIFPNRDPHCNLRSYNIPKELFEVIYDSEISITTIDIKEYTQQQRIEFAKAALAGMLQSVAYIDADIFAKTIARRAFDIADAMVERLNK